MLVDGWVRDILAPFAFPRLTQRKPQTGDQRIWPEADRVTIEVNAGDLLRLQVLLGLPSETIALAPIMSRPSVVFIAELERIEGKRQAYEERRNGSKNGSP